MDELASFQFGSSYAELWQKLKKPHDALMTKSGSLIVHKEDKNHFIVSPLSKSTPFTPFINGKKNGFESYAQFGFGVAVDVNDCKGSETWTAGNPFDIDLCSAKRDFIGVFCASWNHYYDIDGDLYDGAGAHNVAINEFNCTFITGKNAVKTENDGHTKVKSGVTYIFDPNEPRFRGLSFDECMLILHDEDKAKIQFGILRTTSAKPFLSSDFYTTNNSVIVKVTTGHPFAEWQGFMMYLNSEKIVEPKELRDLRWDNQQSF